MLSDSGKREELATGAQREPQNERGRYDLITPHALRRLAVLYEKGAVKYSDRNWEKGIPASRMFSSATRHMFQWLEGDRAEDHLAAAAWNIFCIMHYEEVLPEMIDTPMKPKTDCKCEKCIHEELSGVCEPCRSCGGKHNNFDPKPDKNCDNCKFEHTSSKNEPCNTCDDFDCWEAKGPKLVQNCQTCGNLNPKNTPEKPGCKLKNAFSCYRDGYKNWIPKEADVIPMPAIVPEQVDANCDNCRFEHIDRDQKPCRGCYDGEVFESFEAKSCSNCKHEYKDDREEPCITCLTVGADDDEINADAEGLRMWAPKTIKNCSNCDHGQHGACHYTEIIAKECKANNLSRWREIGSLDY